ncbi:MAG: DUF6179 domain-containing protein [Syntrophomonas sp.]
MNHKAIEKYRYLGNLALDPKQYTIALLKAAYQEGIVEYEVINSIQAQLMILLKDLIMRRTKGESTSLKVETAQGILLSILYCIDACTKTFCPAEDAIRYLIKHPLKEIYGEGLELVVSCLAESRLQYYEIKNKKMDIVNKAYQSTIDEALPEFFKNYDVVFQAHDTMAGIDYPLLFDDMTTGGVFYIKQYLDKLNMETQFCSLFLPTDITKLLMDYGRVYQIDYRDALINIFEVVLTNAIFSKISGNNASVILISKSNYMLLKNKFKGWEQKQISNCMEDAIKELLEDLHIEQAQLSNYIRSFKPVLFPRFLSALNYDSLTNVIITYSEGNPTADIVFDAGTTMGNDHFRSLVNQIRKCLDSKNKIAMISSSIYALGDFIDVLEADCLFNEEFLELYSTLGDIELSVLARIVFIEEIRSDPTGFSLKEAILDKELDMEWQGEYVRYLHQQEFNKLESIERYLRANLLGQ